MQYLETGIILKVRPRITRDGMVFLDIVQEVSKPTGVADGNGNVRIDTNKVKTSAVVPSGETIMLAGLITDSASKNSIRHPRPEPDPDPRRLVRPAGHQQGTRRTGRADHPPPWSATRWKHTN